MIDQQALRAAIERLPLAQGVSVDHALQALSWGCYFAGVNELPRMRSSQKENGPAKELEEFVKLAGRLRRHLNGMHRESLNVLSVDRRHSLAVDCDLEDMIGRATSAIDSLPDTPASTSPKQLAQQQIAQMCAKIYTGVTGKRAALHWNAITEKKGGPFIRFVQDVFAACEVDASAEHYARDAEKAEIIGGNGGVSMKMAPIKKGIVSPL